MLLRRSRRKLMNCDDYRNTKYCPKLEHVESKKEKLKSEISSKHPRVQNYYNVVKKNSDCFKRLFAKIYNYKCAYCGISLEILTDLSDFEIDHFKCESSFDSQIDAGILSNLVLACRPCNHSKHEYLIDGNYLKLLNPDLNNIAEVFARDERYNIVITSKYKDDKTIKGFYYKLRLDSEICRLDFLLMNINGLISKLNGCNSPLSSALLELYKVKDKFLKLKKSNESRY